MFETNIYVERRNILKNKFDSGVLLFLGNEETPANYTANTYAFRQDSSFLYYFGIDRAGFAAIIDIDNNLETIFANDFSIDDIVWMGPQLKVSELAENTGIYRTAPLEKLAEQINNAIRKGRKIHFLPQVQN